MKVLIDTDIVLDVLLDRQPFVDTSVRVWRAHEQGLCEGYVAAMTPLNIAYVVRRLRDRATALAAVDGVLAAFGICAVTTEVLRRARALPMTDIEDATQAAGAEMSGMAAIITRNGGDFIGAPLPVYAPADFLAYLSLHGAGQV